jgi:hypothetical protein
MDDQEEWTSENSQSAIVLECCIEVFTCLVIGGLFALTLEFILNSR